MSKGYATQYFNARGQSDRARGVPVFHRREQSREWPKWAMWAYHHGWTYNDAWRHFTAQREVGK